MKNCIDVIENPRKRAHAATWRFTDWLETAVWGILQAMKVTLAYVSARPGGGDEIHSIAGVYLERCAGFGDCKMQAFRTEKALMGWLEHQRGRTTPIAALLDSRGKQMSSEMFAAWLGARRDEGKQHIVFAIGPADGWSEAARRQAQLLLSLGPMTLAHGLARAVMAEQLYRAFTILTGHPYHGGH